MTTPAAKEVGKFRSFVTKEEAIGASFEKPVPVILYYGSIGGTLSGLVIPISGRYS